MDMLDHLNKMHNYSIRKILAFNLFLIYRYENKSVINLAYSDVLDMN